jgi:hypothetical protein
MANRKRKTRTVYRYKKRRRRRRSKRIPLLPTITAANFAIVEPLFGRAGHFGGAVRFLQEGRPPAEAFKEFTDVLGYNFLGYKFSNGDFNWTYPMQTYTALILSYVGHMLANKLGVNTHLKRIPLVGKYISI